MKGLKWITRKHYIISGVVIMLLIYIMIVIVIYAFRKNNWASWDAINALGQWAGILVAVLIPITAVYLEKQLEKNKNEIEQKKGEIKNSNVSIFDEIQKIKKDIDNIKNNQNNIQPISNSEIDKIMLKDDIYKYICISMGATTKEIMNKFDIEFKNAKDILLELSRVEEKISVAYLSDNPNDENCHWIKKR